MDAPADILVVDDEPHICNLIRDGLASAGLRCATICDPREALRAMQAGKYQVVVADISMPHVTGLELLAHAQRGNPDCRVILITGVPSTDSLARALSLGAYDYFAKPFDIVELIAAIGKAAVDHEAVRVLPRKAAQAMQQGMQIRRYSLESIRALVHAVEAKDPYTRRHSEQVAHYAVAISEVLELDDAAAESVRVASLLHDVGKIGTPDIILTKAGPLTEEEFEHIRRHPQLGAEILENMSMFTQEAELVRYHHENYDGSGYLACLSGQDIPLGARIIRLADSVDAMLMRRTYKEPYPLPQVLEQLRGGKGKEFDPDVVEAFLDWCRENPRKLIQAKALAS